MMIPEGMDAIAYYGSFVRGDNDRFSDRDILLVSDDKDALEGGKTSLSKQGYSCSCYDWAKLDLLSSKRALFIQHLKQESKVIVDKDSKLQALLAGYSPATEYSKHIDAARSLFSLTECFADTPVGIGWALDVLTIAFRNLAILTLANEGQYVFSFSELVSGLRRLGLIGYSLESSLVGLRRHKSCFRNKQFSSLPKKESVFELQRIIGETFDSSLESKAVSEESFHDYCLYSRKASHIAQWYLKARLYEGAFLTLNRSSKNVDVKTISRFQDVQNALANPACYSALFSNSADNLRREVTNLTRELGLRAI